MKNDRNSELRFPPFCSTKLWSPLHLQWCYWRACRAITKQGPLVLVGSSGFQLQAPWVQCHMAATNNSTASPKRPRGAWQCQKAISEKPLLLCTMGLLLKCSPKMQMKSWGPRRVSERPASSAESFPISYATPTSYYNARVQCVGVSVSLKWSWTGKICRPREMWQLLSVFYGVEREKECLKYCQRFDSSAVGQEKKA